MIWTTKNDPIYLFQAYTQKASLGVLSVAGNLCERIIADVGKCVNESLLKLALVLECLEDFGALCKDEEKVYGSIEEVIK